jgi:hypothetical protein
MVSFLILVDGTIIYDEYSTPARWSRVTLAHTNRIAWCCLFSYFISELRRGGLWAFLNLAATPDEAVSIICTVCWQNYTFKFFGRSWCMWAILLIGQYFSKASHRCSSYNLSVGSFNMVDLCLWDALSRWCSFWRIFTPPMCMPISFGLGTSTHVCSWSIIDRYIIK